MTAKGMATFYDTHAHLDYPDYAKDLPEVIARAAGRRYYQNHFHRDQPQQQ